MSDRWEQAGNRNFLPALFFLLSVAYVPTIPSAGVAGRWAVLAIAVPLLLLLSPSPRAAPHRSSWLAAAASLWAALGMLWTISPWDTAGALLQWSILIGLFLLASRVESLDDCWKALSLGLTLQTPVAVAQYFGYHPVQDLWFAFNHAGVAGLFVARNAFAEVSALVLVAAVAWKLPWWFIVGPLLNCLLVLLDDSREPIIIAAFVAALYLRPAVLLLLAVPIVAYAAVGTVQSHSAVERLQIIGDSLSVVSVFGSGLNTYTMLFPEYDFAHNDFLQFVVELGIGSVFLFMFLISVFLRSEQRSRAVMLALAGAACVWNPLQTATSPTTLALAALLFGHACRERVPVRNSEPERRANGSRRFFGLSGARPASSLRPAGSGSLCVPF